jgi:hypothetical protein
MANLGPEIGRIESFSRNGNVEAMDGAKQRSFEIIESVLAMPDLSLAGREEINILKNLLASSADDQTIVDIQKYCKPFAERFMLTLA